MSLAWRPLFDSGFAKFTPTEVSTASFYWIDWNVYVTDKFIPLTERNLQTYNIGHIIAILPSKDELSSIITTGTTPYTLLAYGATHDEKLPIDDYERLGTMIREMRNNNKLVKGKNVLVFCNNGFQRSLPFLVYVLLNFQRQQYPRYQKVWDVLRRIFERLPFIAGGGDKDVISDSIEYLLSKPENAPPKKV
jgi:hypothetical protein